MRKTHSKSSWSLLRALGRHVLALVICWVIALAFVQLGERTFGGWPASEAGQLIACVVGVAISLRMRAPLAAYVVAALAAFSVSELAIHLDYGIRAVQGAPTHVAVMGSGFAGVALGALLMMRGQLAPPLDTRR